LEIDLQTCEMPKTIYEIISVSH